MSETVEPAAKKPAPAGAKILLRGFYILAAVLVLAAFAFKILQPIQVVPRIRLAPGFALTDQAGEMLTNEDLRGQFVLYTFFYTRCPEPCNHINEIMQEIQDRLGEIDLGDTPITFVSISIDPAYDTPERLAAYAAAHNADLERWSFATTTNEILLKTIIGSGFEVYYERQTDGSFQFDTAFVLVDGWGIIRSQYKYQTMLPEADRILRHIETIAIENRNSQGIASLAYEAAHLFLCYTP